MLLRLGAVLVVISAIGLASTQPASAYVNCGADRCSRCVRWKAAHGPYRQPQCLMCVRNHSPACESSGLGRWIGPGAFVGRR